MAVGEMKILGIMHRYAQDYDAEAQFDHNGVSVGLGVCPSNSLATLLEFAKRFVSEFELDTEPAAVEVFFEWLTSYNVVVINVLQKEGTINSRVIIPEGAQVSTIRFGRIQHQRARVGEILGQVWSRDFSLQFLSPPAQPAENQPPAS